MWLYRKKNSLLKLKIHNLINVVLQKKNESNKSKLINNKMFLVQGSGQKRH